ncbi:MAG: hypothetical protein ACREYC_08680, partial [Gammaproteobacteria bacterium]
EAKADPNRVFTNLAHLIDEDLLRAAFWRTRKDGAPGVDGVTGGQYEQNLDENLRDLHRRLKEREYHAQPVRRVYIEKEGGKERALGLPAFGDKVVQRAVGCCWRRSTSRTSIPVRMDFDRGRARIKRYTTCGKRGCKGG